MTTIHPTAIIGDLVDLGPDVWIGPYVVIVGPVSIGARTRIYPGAVIGTSGEHRTATPSGWVRIGDDCEIREGCAIQRGTGDCDTTLGHRVLAMHGSHLAHDCVVGDDCTISPNAVLGGHTRVGRGCTVGIGAMTHQFTTLGAWSMIGMGSVVTRDVPPFALVCGNPARFVRENIKGGEAAAKAGATRSEAMAAFLSDSRRKSMTVTPWGDG